MYGDGHVICWLAHWGGNRLPLQVDGGLSLVQSTHVAPKPPHWLLRKPGWHSWFVSQQPWQLFGLHADWHAWPWHVSPCIVQSKHCAPPAPHALFIVPGTHTLPWQHLPWQQPKPHVCALHCVCPWQV
jgi:hypothetical protein